MGYKSRMSAFSALPCLSGTAVPILCIVLYMSSAFRLHTKRHRPVPQENLEKVINIRNIADRAQIQFQGNTLDAKVTFVRGTIDAIEPGQDQKIRDLTEIARLADEIGCSMKVWGEYGLGTAKGGDFEQHLKDGDTPIEGKTRRQRYADSARKRAEVVQRLIGTDLVTLDERACIAADAARVTLTFTAPGVHSIQSMIDEAVSQQRRMVRSLKEAVLFLEAEDPEDPECHTLVFKDDKFKYGLPLRPVRINQHGVQDRDLFQFAQDYVNSFKVQPAELVLPNSSAAAGPRSMARKPSLGRLAKVKLPPVKLPPLRSSLVNVTTENRSYIPLQHALRELVDLKLIMDRGPDYFERQINVLLMLMREGIVDPLYDSATADIAGLEVQGFVRDNPPQSFSPTARAEVVQLQNLREQVALAFMVHKAGEGHDTWRSKLFQRLKSQSGKWTGDVNVAPAAGGIGAGVVVKVILSEYGKSLVAQAMRPSRK